MNLPNLDPILLIALAVLLAVALTGCARQPDISQPAICAGTIHQRDDLNDAALEDGGKATRIAAANLLKILDSACADS